MTEEQTKTKNTPEETVAAEEETNDIKAEASAQEVEVEQVAEEAEPAPEDGAEESDAPEVEKDELAVLREQIAAAQAQADEYLDDLRRERAAFQNYKKRQENERTQLRHMAVSGLAMQILPIIDDLERALAAVPEEQSDQPWVEGIKLIQRKLHTTLEAVGVLPVDAEPGQAFDPFIHEAVSYEEHDDHDEGQIIAVVQRGYKLGERTLRPAMVRVAK